MAEVAMTLEPGFERNHPKVRRAKALHREIVAAMTATIDRPDRKTLRRWARTSRKFMQELTKDVELCEAFVFVATSSSVAIVYAFTKEGEDPQNVWKRLQALQDEWELL